MRFGERRSSRGWVRQKPFSQHRQSLTGNHFRLVALQPNFYFSSPFPVRSLLLSYTTTVSPIRLFSFLPLDPSVTHLSAWWQLLISTVVCPAPVVGDNYSNDSAPRVVVADGQVKIQLRGERAGWMFYIENKNKKKTQKKKERLWPIFWIWVENFGRSKRNKRVQYYSTYYRNQHLVFHMIFILLAKYFGTRCTRYCSQTSNHKINKKINKNLYINIYTMNK